MLSTMKQYTITLLILLSSIINITIIHAQADLPESVVQQIKSDTPQVLLVQTTNDGIESNTIEAPCGTETYYDTSALVLEVKKTIDPDATYIGAAKGEVIDVCDTVEFTTYEKEWIEEECDAKKETGRRDEGWCGYVYLTPSMNPSDPYKPSAGYRSFEEEDASVCEQANAAAACDSSGASGGDSGSSESTESSNGSVKRKIQFGSITVALSMLVLFGI